MALGDLFCIGVSRMWTVTAADVVAGQVHAISYTESPGYGYFDYNFWVLPNKMTIIAEPAGLTAQGSKVEIWKYAGASLPQFGPRLRPNTWIVALHVTLPGSAVVYAVVVNEEDDQWAIVGYDDVGLGSDFILIAPPA